MCVIDRHDVTIAAEVALNPNTTTNQPINQPTSQCSYQELCLWSEENGWKRRNCLLPAFSPFMQRFQCPFRGDVTVRIVP